MFHIALFEPQIAPNTGNVIRLCSNNGFHLHLIEPLGFSMEEKQLRRASLDYADLARVTTHKNYEAFQVAMGERRIFACTTKGSVCYAEQQFQDEDVLLFGSETAGLPDAVRNGAFERIRVPMMPDARSLNLSNTVALISYEAWRQVGFIGGI